MSKKSSFLVLPKSKVYRLLFLLYEWLSAATEPLVWILDRRVKTILDVGCGQGYPMKRLRILRSVRATGVDLFPRYIKEAKKSGIYEKVIRGDVTKLKFKPKSFDAVICLQVIEHVTKKDGLKMIKSMEKLAKYQVIIATPYHFFEHPDMDNNKLQRHLSHWPDEEFKKMGYSVHHQSLEIFFGNDGLVHKNIPKVFKAFIFTLDHILTPLYWFVPGIANYWTVAHKKFK